VAARRCLWALHVDSSSAPSQVSAMEEGTGVWLRGVAGAGEGAVAVGDVDGFVVGDVAGQAVPEDLEPAVAQGAQRGVVAFAAGALLVVELPRPAGSAQAGEGPLLHGVGEEPVAGQAARDDQ